MKMININLPLETREIIKHNFQHNLRYLNLSLTTKQKILILYALGCALKGRETKEERKAKEREAISQR